METISRLTADRLTWLSLEFAGMNRARREGHFQSCLESQERGELVALIARAEEDLLGFVKVLWTSDYAPFKEQMIPEINDLLVTPPNRRRGVASRLMDEAEKIIHTRSSVVGIGVGLHPGYAAAQRMYVLRGYVPDGNPLTYRNEFVREGQEVCLDDDLVMYLTKELKPSGSGA